MTPTWILGPTNIDTLEMMLRHVWQHGFLRWNSPRNAVNIHVCFWLKKKKLNLKKYVFNPLGKYIRKFQLHIKIYRETEREREERGGWWRVTDGDWNVHIELMRLWTTTFIAVLPNTCNYVSSYPSQLLKKLPRSLIFTFSPWVYPYLFKAGLEVDKVHLIPNNDKQETDKKDEGGWISSLVHEADTTFWVKPLSAEAKCLSICFKFFTFSF